jgi:large subunit ribosomal protein L4
MLRGGAKAFGPRPRDFGTELPKKMYDLAWRTALSYRYRRGQLIVCEDGADIDYARGSYLENIFHSNGWGRAHGRSTIITTEVRDNLYWAMKYAEAEGRALEVDDVDVKDLLETGRIIIEKSALDQILKEHRSDLKKSVPMAV